VDKNNIGAGTVFNSRQRVTETNRQSCSQPWDGGRLEKERDDFTATPAKGITRPVSDAICVITHEVFAAYQRVEVADRRQSFDGDDLVGGGEHDVRRTADRHRRHELRHKLSLHDLHRRQHVQRPNRPFLATNYINC